ncbi:MAG: hypothetical protein WC100_00780 [Sterolibacterium sp.]
MARQHSPLQQIKEARQIAKDFNLFLSEKKIGDRTDYLLFRITGGGHVFIGKRSSPAGIRQFVAQVANCR